MPSRTPIFADCFWVVVRPGAIDAPARDLYQGGTAYGMQRLTIARHGSVTPKSAPRNLPPGAVLPGSINIMFYHGHTQAVRLEDLWSLYWQNDYVPLASRPK